MVCGLFPADAINGKGNGMTRKNKYHLLKEEKILLDDPEIGIYIISLNNCGILSDI